jgi:hypothetical protein
MLSMCFSDKQASAQAVHVSTQMEQASMHALIVSEWAGWSGCDRNMALTAGISHSFYLFRSRTRGVLEEPPRDWLVPRNLMFEQPEKVPSAHALSCAHCAASGKRSHCSANSAVAI